MQGASALLALLEPDADPDTRFDGALVVMALVQDIHLIRLGLFGPG